MFLAFFRLMVMLNTFLLVSRTQQTYVLLQWDQKNFQVKINIDRTKCHNLTSSAFTLTNTKLHNFKLTQTTTLFRSTPTKDTYREELVDFFVRATTSVGKLNGRGVCKIVCVNGTVEFLRYIHNGFNTQNYKVYVH